jgi:hypothetical protein
MSQPSCCPSTSSYLLAYPKRWYPASFSLQSMTWDSGHLVCKVCPASVVKSTSSRPAILLRLGSRSTSATSIWSKQTNQSQPNTVSTWASLNSRIPPSYPPRKDTWTRRLGRPLRLSYTQITWTGSIAFVSASHGNPSFTSSKDIGGISCSTVNPHLATSPYSPFQYIPQYWPVLYFLLLISYSFFLYFPSVFSCHVHPPSRMSTDQLLFP